MWPDIAIRILMEKLSELMPGNPVQSIPLDPTAPSGTIAIYAASWQPGEDSHFIGHDEPQDNEYLITIQNLVVSGDQVEGRRLHGADCKAIRTILYRVQSIRLALGEMDEDFLGSFERFRSLDVTRQNFMSGRGPTRAFQFLGETTVRVRTTTTPHA